ncbi:cob(I)yrinic acid a,c-diamide adenosyltransferase [Clostridium cellulovorans]|uniref:ATP:corrinoid adenosyltransferase BtuR/CobO/CobP n=1 Tax=Clostridium cellulovorans (strain ATCC 35296 / DSM 3052 / OCM 3 / 743B) TaxID=573061 RepID=D9SNY9_CLOC7|nr:cob(I)yrinic acid a,c-diamide adenosyltransferase [Clostridium cellulovorans]ADL51954.1 ATP:corrinoid adenosyltransferase BtuR/CobO/CobP [Clostridium cellulovorans 743B]
MKDSCVHIYCGDGKGKTTAAMGLCIRAAGSGKKVVIYQFLKNNTTSEIDSLNRIPNITRIEGKDKMKFTFTMTEEEKEELKNYYNEKFKEIVDFVQKTNAELLFLDEIIYAILNNVFEEENLIEFLNKKPKTLEVVLTGRNPSEELIELADYVSEIKKIKHPFEKGIPSRKGIEN